MKRAPDQRQVSLLPPDAAAALHLIRENLRALHGLVQHFEVAWLSPTDELTTVHPPEDVAANLGPEMADLAQEQLRVVLLNTKNAIVGSVLVYQGGLNATVVRIADIYREAVRAGVAAIILVHNHPSGDPTPSPEDVRLTKDVAKAGELLGIELLDHVVIGRGRDQHVSLRARGLYAPSAVRSAVTPE